MSHYYEDWKKTENAQKELERWVRDPEGLLTGNGYCSGVYEIRFVNNLLGISTSAYIGQAGDEKTAPYYVAKNVYEHILQHLKRWLGGGYFTYWTGLDETTDSDWKIELHLLEEVTGHSSRLRAETEYIDRYHPFLQDTAGGKFDLYPSKYGYKRNDLCLSPWQREGEENGQRREAFLHRIKKLKKDD